MSDELKRMKEDLKRVGPPPLNIGDAIEWGIELDELEHKANWQFLLNTYEAHLDITLTNKIFQVKSVVFHKHRWTPPPKIDNGVVAQLYKHTKSKQALVVCSEYMSVYGLENLLTTKTQVPWITATLWKKPKKKEIAWKLLLKNALVIDRFHEPLGPWMWHIIVCDEMSELMQKSPVPHPSQQVPNLIVDPLI